MLRVPRNITLQVSPKKQAIAAFQMQSIRLAICNQEGKRKPHKLANRSDKSRRKRTLLLNGTLELEVKLIELEGGFLYQLRLCSNVTRPQSEHIAFNISPKAARYRPEPSLGREESCPATSAISHSYYGQRALLHEILAALFGLVELSNRN